jgi:iron complex outermembrane receptor protein
MRNMRKLIMIMLVLFSYSVNAQVFLEDAIDTTKVSKLDTIVLKGVRADAKTPVTQKSYTNIDIQKVYSGQELPILLSKTPAVVSNSDGGHPQGYTYFRLRGMDQTRINMTLNGVPLNEPEDQGVYFSNYPNFAKNIKTMQVQRGVGTSTNGVSSFAGSINFTSPTGIREKTELEAEYGSWNTSRFNFTHESGFIADNKLSMYFNASVFNTDGYKYHSGSKGFSLFYSLSYYGETDKVTLTTFTGKSNNEMAWYAVSESDIEKDPKTNYNHEDADDNFRQTLVMLEYKRFINSDNDISLTGFYNRLDGEWDLYVGDMLNFGLGSNFYGLISNYNYSPNKFDINVGVSANGYNRDHSMVVLPDSDFKIYDNTGYKNEISTYGKVKYDLDVLTLFADVQYRYVTFDYKQKIKDGVPYAFDLTKQDWSFFNPKIGLTYNVSDNLKFYTTLGKSNREPTRSDMFGGEDDLVTFEEVIPEEVLDYELGVNYTSPKFSGHANLYYMDFDNEITLLGALGSYSLQQFGNVEQSYRAGLEVDLNWAVHNEVTLTYNGAFSDNQIHDQGVYFSPLYTPEVIQNLAVNLHKDGMFIEVSVKHHSKSYIDFANENTTPAFGTVGMVWGYETEHFRYKIQGINLGSADYYTNGYMDGGEAHYYVNAPASVYATLTYKF